MGCFPCFMGPTSVGEEDAHKPDAFMLTIRLSKGLQVPVHSLPTDTIADIRRKVEREYGVQPKLSINGQMVTPPIMALNETFWLPVRPDATMKDLDLQTRLRFAAATDKLNKVTVLRHVHWAPSNAFVLARAVS